MWKEEVIFMVFVWVNILFWNGMIERFCSDILSNFFNVFNYYLQMRDADNNLTHLFPSYISCVTEKSATENEWGDCNRYARVQSQGLVNSLLLNKDPWSTLMTWWAACSQKQDDEHRGGKQRENIQVSLF